MTDDAQVLPGTTSPSGPPALPALPEAQELAQGLGVLIYNTLNHHWFSNTDERETLVAYYALVAGCLTRTEELLFKLVGKSLTVNGAAPREVERYIEALVEQMDALQMGNVVFRRGISVDEMHRLVHLMTSTPDELEALGGFSGALTSRGISNVASRTIVYREIAEDDVVVSGKELATAVADAGKPVPGPEEHAEHALMQLKAEGMQSISASSMQAMRELAADTKRLATLVLQAARARSENERTLADGLVRTLQRTFEAWMKSDDTRTQKGKKRVQKDLRALEKEVLGMLEGMPAETQAACQNAIMETVAGMEDHLQVDVLAAEYLKRMKAIEQSEKRLRRYLKARGAAGAPGTPEAALEDRLVAGGIPAERLLALVGAAGGGDSGDAEKLGTLLANLEKAGAGLGAGGAGAPGGGKPAEEDLDSMLQAVRSEISRIVERTAEKIWKVTEEVRVDEAAMLDIPASEQGGKLTKRKILEMLAEIVQELRQPLSVVQCSVEMIMGRVLGAITPAQTDMLKLVAESTTKLQTLVDGLQGIAGLPATMSPDRELLNRVTQG